MKSASVKGANRVILSPTEWNVLVQSIKRGELDEVKLGDEGVDS